MNALCYWGLFSNCLVSRKQNPQDDHHYKYNEYTWDYKNDPEYWNHASQDLMILLFIEQFLSISLDQLNHHEKYHKH